MKRASFLPAAVALCALVATGCSSGSSGGGASDGSPFRVAVIAGQTGPVAPVTEDVLLGLRTAADELNRTGGVGGRQVEVEVLDSQSDPTRAVSQLQSLINSGDPVDMVYAGITSPETLAMLPMLTENDVFSMSSTAAPQINDPAKYPFHFGMSLTNTDTHKILSSRLRETGAKTLGLLLPADAYGDSVVAAVTAAAQDAGVSIAATERFDPKALDYTVQYQRVMAANPDAVFMDSTGGEPIGRLFDARRTAGGMGTPVLGGNGTAGTVPVRVANKDALGNCAMFVYDFTVASSTPEPALAPLAAAVAAAGADRSVYVPGVAYDMLRMAAKASATAQGTDGKAMAKAMVDLQVPAGESVHYPAGLDYSDQSHFPTASEGTQRFIPCDTALDAGFWRPAT